MNRTKIEWVKNPDGSQGYTWNPITGCLNGCEYCYARKLANGRLKQRYLANNNTAPRFYGEQFVEDMLVMNDPFYPRFWEDRLEAGKDFLFSSQWRRYTKPVGVFVCDMSDLFGIGVPESWTGEVLQVIRDASAHSSHRFYLLTKQPQNLIKFSPFSDNCWVGVTATDDKMMIEAIKYLKDIQAKVKYISIEPFLERINTYWLDVYLKDASIGWIIQGSQTKPYKPPEGRWIREITHACNMAKIPYFLKDNLAKVRGDYHWNSGDWIELRQELPIERP